MISGSSLGSGSRVKAVGGKHETKSGMITILVKQMSNISNVCKSVMKLIVNISKFGDHVYKDVIKKHT